MTGVDPLIEGRDWTSENAGGTPGRWRLLRRTGEALPFADGAIDLVLFDLFGSGRNGQACL